MAKQMSADTGRNRQWVWTGDGRPNQYVALRLVVDRLLPETLPDVVSVDVSAGTLYQLFVNGHCLGRGPVREWAGHAGMDRHDLRPWLQPGRNVISALVHYYGARVGGYQQSPPGFLLVGSLGDQPLSTGVAPWQALDLAAWDPESSQISLYNGFNEWVDLARWQPRVWQLGSDAAWQPALPVPEAARERSILQPRQIPPLREQPLPPMTLLSSAPGEMIFDAGRIVAAIIDLSLDVDTPLQLEIHYGDRFEKGAFIGDHGGVNCTVDHLQLQAGRNRWRGSFTIRGFRYLRLAWNPALAAPRDIRIIPHEITYATIDRAIFQTSDPWLDACWEGARLTARLCMFDTYMDNCTRERQQYGGDGYMQSLYGYACFGDLALWRQFLRHYRQGRREDGAIQSGGPWCWDQIIPAWTLLWIESIGEYVEHTRDRSIIQEHAAAIVDALAWFEPMLGQDHLLTVEERWGWEGAPGGVLWNFIDWQVDEVQLTGEAARLTLNGLYAMALRTAAALLRQVGREEDAQHCDARYRELAPALTDALADAPGEHALVAASLGGIDCDLEPVARAAKEHRAISDVMYLFLTVKALVGKGWSAAAMTLINDTFAPMMEAGHTTFWEARHIPDGSSRAFCQGIGGLPVYWLPRLVGGIRDISARHRTVTLAAPLHRIAHAHLRLPCADGEIDMMLRDGQIVECHLPPEWRTISASTPICT